MHFDIPTGIGGLLVGLFFAWLCANMARNRKRDTTVWALLGFFFPCLTPIILLVIGDK